ncbi:hypothetical protein MKX01_002098 [Papaver californicum]|nr:hypothetical protein MKX01_002098 [Papaver californicum]
MAINQPLPNNSIVVIAPHYCTPHQVDLYVARKVLNVTEGNNLGVFDINGSNIFKVKSMGKRRILVDAAGVPIVSLEQKKFSAHDRWKVYKEDSPDSNDLLFGVKRTKSVQLKTEVDVFLASNTAEYVCDFKIKQNYRKKSCVIYQGDSLNIIAEMHKKQTVQDSRTTSPKRDRFKCLGRMPNMLLGHGSPASHTNPPYMGVL